VPSRPLIPSLRQWLVTPNPSMATLAEADIQFPDLTSPFLTRFTA
jgi:hypothetical protein